MLGQENTARIKLKNKLSKRLLPINIINGKLYEGESIYNNQIEIGKVLIIMITHLLLIKYLDKNFDEKLNLKLKKLLISIKNLIGLININKFGAVGETRTLMD